MRQYENISGGNSKFFLCSTKIEVERKSKLINVSGAPWTKIMLTLYSASHENKWVCATNIKTPISTKTTERRKKNTNLAGIRHFILALYWFFWNRRRYVWDTDRAKIDNTLYIRSIWGLEIIRRWNQRGRSLDDKFNRIYGIWGNDFASLIMREMFRLSRLFRAIFESYISTALLFWTDFSIKL